MIWCASVYCVVMPYTVVVCSTTTYCDVLHCSAYDLVHCDVIYQVEPRYVELMVGNAHVHCYVVHCDLV